MDKLCGTFRAMSSNRYVATCPVCPDEHTGFTECRMEKEAEVEADIHNGLVHYDQDYATVTTTTRTAAD